MSASSLYVMTQPHPTLDLRDLRTKIAPMSKKTFILTLILVAALKIWLALAIPLTADEGLHWMQGRHLAWGFTDHPPGTAFLNRIGYIVFGSSLLGVRLFPVLSTTLCSLIAFAILKEIGHEEGAARKGGVLLQIMPLFLFGIIMVPVYPAAVLILTAEYFLIRAFRSGRLADHLLWGAFLGVSVMTYHITVTAIAAALVFCLTNRKSRAVFSHPPFWAGAALALAVAAPNIWWNISEGANSAIAFQLLERSPYAFDALQPVSYVLLLILIAGPMILPALVLSAKNLLGRSSSRTDWTDFFSIFIVVPIIGFLLLSFFREAGAHWAIVSFLNVPLLLVSLKKSPADGFRKWFKANMVYSSIIATVAVVILAAGPERCVRFVDPGGNLVSRRKLGIFFGAQSAGEVSHEFARSLSGRDRDITLATDRWGRAGILSFYTPGNPYYFLIPPPSRHGRDYRLWNTKFPPSSDVIFVSGRRELREGVRDTFASAELLNIRDPEVSEAYSMYLCKGFRP